MPFIALPGIYTGPVARELGGIDVGWLVGLLVGGSVYLWLMRSFDLNQEAAAIHASRQLLGH
jgi:purine-cytosine permease-like protein